MRPRVYTAVIRDQQVLMVRHIHDGRDYWTLPGGGVEPGETPAQAAEREVFEETGIRIDAPEELFRDGKQTCFLASCAEDQVAKTGYDPELVGHCQMIREVQWFPIEEKGDDLQVSKVLAAMRQRGV